MLHEIKKEISMTTKKSYTLEKDIRSLDQKIALLIRNRISLEVGRSQSIVSCALNTRVSMLLPAICAARAFASRMSIV